MLVASADNRVDREEIDAIFRFFSGADPSYIKGLQESLSKDLRNPQSIDWEHNANVAIYLFADPDFSDYEIILFDGLLSVSASDGRIDPAELSVIAGIMGRLGWNDAKIADFLKNRFAMAKVSSEKERRSRAFEILGLPEESDRESIKSAFRKLAKQHHPDVVAHMGEHFKRSAEERFREIKEAHDVLLPNLTQ